MTSASLAVYPGLKKMKVPFIIFSVALGVLEIASDILRSAGVGTKNSFEEIRLMKYFYSWREFNSDYYRDNCFDLRGWHVYILFNCLYAVVETNESQSNRVKQD